MKKKIAIGHPVMGRGGSEARAMWLLQMLKDDYDVTLVTTCTVDLEDLNRFYGTSVQHDEIKIRIAQVPFFMRNNSRIAGLRGAFYARLTKQIGREYNLCISAYNITDWGIPAVHFIADFVWDRDLAEKFDPVPEKGARLIHKDNFLRKLYLITCHLVSGGQPRTKESFFDGSEMIISNSKWSADIIKKKYQYDCDDIAYPPVWVKFKNVKWEKKKLGFVSIGSLVQEKRIVQQIEILEKVRLLGHKIDFHIIGGIGNDPYGQLISKRCEGKPWITLEGRKSGVEKETLLTGNKFAIHARPNEAFGITVAELIKAGCIPFIPDTGGQVEIMPFDELQFHSIDEAVKIIDCMLRDEEAQQRILKKLAVQKDKFSADLFCHDAHQIVKEWFADRKLKL